MFPFRPRPPALGGKLKRKRASLGTADVDQLAEGGPVERAIKKDLTILKTQFRNHLRHGSSSSSSSNSKHHASGQSFLYFKTAFRQGKFGALHTRCIPPRSDREAYTQLIYSAALSLFTTSMDRLMKQNPESMLTTNDDDYVDSVCALFTLYTLYSTCPLPTVPPGTSEKKQVQEDVEAWSCLPMGLSSTDDSRATFRRVYKSPIRLSRRHYLLMELLWDIALKWISSCERRRQTTPITQERSSTLPWKCSCSLASDCICIIQRLNQNQSFDFCEYCGPVSVEGLAGSEDYYKFVVLSQNVSSTTQTQSVTGSTLSSNNQTPPTNEEVNLTLLQSCHSDYHEKVSQLFRSEKLQSLGTSSRQTQSLKSTLSPILENRRLTPLTDQFAKTLALLQGTLGPSANANIPHPSQSLHTGPIETLNDEQHDNNHGTRDSAIYASIPSNLNAQDASSSLPFRLSFSPNISEPIRKAVESVMKSSQMNIVSTNKPHSSKVTTYDDWLWDDFVSKEETNESAVVNNDSESEQQEEDDELITSAPVFSNNGDSKNALQRLLSLAQYRKD